VTGTALRTAPPRTRAALAGLALGLALAVASGRAVVVVAAVPLGLLALVHPHLILAALPATVLVAQRLSVSLGGLRLGPVEVAVVAVAVAWVAKGVANRRLELSAQAIPLVLLAWVWAITLSLLGSSSLRAGLTEAAKWIEILLLATLVPLLAPGGRARYVVWGVAAAGVASALLGLLQFITGSGPPGFLLMGRFMRAYGTFQQPNPFAAHLGLSLPFALAWALAGPAGKRERWLLLAAAGLMGLGVLASWSRGAWLGLAVAAGLMAALMWKRVAVVALVLLLITSPLWVGPASSSALAQRALGMGGGVEGFNVAQVEPTDENWSVVERLAHWQASWRMFEDRPWLGVGFGNYEVVYGAYSVPRWSDPLGHAHNYYLNVLAETGLVGLATYIALGVTVWVTLARAWWRRPRGQAGGLLLAAIGVLAYLSVHSIVDNLYVHGMQVLVGLALAAPAWGAGEDAATTHGVVPCRSGL